MLQVYIKPLFALKTLNLRSHHNLLHVYLEANPGENLPKKLKCAQNKNIRSGFLNVQC